jgi:hypothetical protein
MWKVTQANPIPVIAIDGPSSSGKGTVAAALAEKLGFHYLDSGALYRLTALSVLKAGVNPDEEAACEAVARAMKPVFKEGKIFLFTPDYVRFVGYTVCMHRLCIYGCLCFSVFLMPDLRWWEKKKNMSEIF